MYCLLPYYYNTKLKIHYLLEKIIYYTTFILRCNTSYQLPLQLYKQVQILLIVAFVEHHAELGLACTHL